MKLHDYQARLFVPDLQVKILVGSHQPS